MRFRFSTFNHCDMGKRGLEDLIGILSHQMRALGHDVDQGEITDTAVNVLIESFAAEADMNQIARAFGHGCRFIFVATEEPTEKGFNHGVAPGMIDRQDAFPRAAEYAEGILHLVPGDHVTKWYQQFAPAAYAELGFAQSMVYAGPETVPEFDFGFYGQVTYRRQQIINRLWERGRVLVLPNIELPHEERDAQMRRVRVVIQIREHDDMGFVSSSRCSTALCLGRPVVAEPHPVAKAWADVVHFSKTLDSFFDDAVEAAQNWQAIHAFQIANFERLFSPEVCVGEPLRKIGFFTSQERP